MCRQEGSQRLAVESGPVLITHPVANGKSDDPAPDLAWGSAKAAGTLVFEFPTSNFGILAKARPKPTKQPLFDRKLPPRGLESSNIKVTAAMGGP